MPDRDEKVMAMVEKELSKNPDASTEELYEKAKGINQAIGKLTLRQFNARYPLQVKRKLAPKTKRKRSRKKAAPKKTAARSKEDGVRGQVRDVLLDFAAEVAGAKDQAGLVEAVRKVDGYVDRLEKALSKT